VSAKILIVFVSSNRMKLFSALSLAIAVANANPILLEKRADPQGIDVSGFQPSVNWATVKANGVTFAFIKATEGTSLFIQPQPWVIVG
jgi:GH25 family lysozyme M1 (1,4-beta-N-acetylmuramidase)